MSVVAKNPFDLLTEEGEPVAQPNRAKGKEDAPAAAAKPKPKTNSIRSGRYPQRGGKPPAASEGVDQPDGEKKHNDGPSGGRGRGARGGRGGFRGRGRGGGDYRPDRQSATDIDDSAKKYHQGWGGDRGDTELQHETDAAQDAAKEAATGDAEGDAKKDGDAEGGDSKPRKRFEEEEDDGKVTFEEWQKKSTANAAIPKLEVRQANAGATDLFKDALKLEKDTEGEAYFVGKSKNAGGKSSESKKKEEAIVIPTNFSSYQGSGGRGRGRGGPRGGGGGADRGSAPRRGGRTANASRTADINIEDSSAFPPLA